GGDQKHETSLWLGVLTVRCRIASVVAWKRKAANDGATELDCGGVFGGDSGRRARGAGPAAGGPAAGVDDGLHRLVPQRVAADDVDREDAGGRAVHGPVAAVVSGLVPGDARWTRRGRAHLGAPAATAHGRGPVRGVFRAAGTEAGQAALQPAER